MELEKSTRVTPRTEQLNVASYLDFKIKPKEKLC